MGHTDDQAGTVHPDALESALVVIRRVQPRPGLPDDVFKPDHG
jgi:hypothetical protein